MKTTDWDALAASDPLNADAARAWVYSWDQDDEPTLLVHAVREIRAELCRDPGFTNLIGWVAGRLTVVAYGGSIRKGQQARWIVRCVCGRYEFRRTKSLRQRRNVCCQQCSKLASLHGRRP